MQKKYQVYGIGNALLDYEVELSEADLLKSGLVKTTMTLVDAETQTKILHSIQGKTHKKTSGGSAANTMLALAHLGSKAFYTCKVANDESGHYYINKMRELGVDSNFIYQTPDDGLTGKCLVLITPDAERTMGTFLGISENLSVKEVSEEAIANSSYVYLEGYVVTSPTGRQAAIQVRELAEKHGVKTSMTLSDPNMVEYFKDGLLQMLGKKVDLVFCNKQEALKFFRTESLEEAQAGLKQIANQFVITLSSEGALAYDGKNTFMAKSPKVKAVDATGAGDMFAGAFLHSICKGHDFQKSADFACYAAALVVSQYGASLNSENQKLLQKAIADFKI